MSYPATPDAWKNALLLVSDSLSIGYGWETDPVQNEGVTSFYNQFMVGARNSIVVAVNGKLDSPSSIEGYVRARTGEVLTDKMEISDLSEQFAVVLQELFAKRNQGR